MKISSSKQKEVAISLPAIKLPLKPVYIAVVLIVIGALGASVFYYGKYQRTQKLLANPNLVAQEETKDVVNKVGQLFELPKDEVPTMATVSDKSKLASQPFFTHAENGDKVLIYTNMKKALLYRPSINKIIEVGPVNVNPTPVDNTKKQQAKPAMPSVPEAVAPTVQEKVKVAIYNGSKIPGLAGATEKLINEKITSAQVVEKTNSANDYTDNLVINLKSVSDETVQKFITVVSGTKSALPAGEAKPDADILVILGK